MSAIDLKALLSAERYDALSAMAASKLSDERASALNYYMGDMSKDMPAPDGRSKAVSSDVADTIEGLMPPLMDIFAGGDEVVQFAPIGPEDVAAAEQETDYVNHVFMQQNSGFLVLYSFIKDALLSKVGVVKVWWDCRDEVERETYLDQPDDAFALIVAQPGVEIVEHTEREIAPLPHAEEPRDSAASRSMSPGPSFETGANAPSSGRGLSVALASAGTTGQEALPRPKLHDVTIESTRPSPSAYKEAEPYNLRIDACRRADNCSRTGTSTGCRVLFRRDAKVLRRLRKDRALFVDRLGELRWPTRVGNLGSHDKALVDERIGVHHRPDVRGDALA
jgi:hypothetical protein